MRLKKFLVLKSTAKLWVLVFGLTSSFGFASFHNHSYTLNHDGTTNIDSETASVLSLSADGPSLNKDYHKSDQKHFINTKLVEIMEYRQSRKWYVSIAVVGLFSFILALMIYFMAMGKDVTDGWKEILLLMLGGFVGSFAKVIDFWFNNQENDNKLLEHADD